MYKLIHEKANAVNAIRLLTEKLIKRLENIDDDDEQLSGVGELLAQRQKKIDEIGALDMRLEFLESSGYQPKPEEQHRIDLEEGTILALLRTIQALDKRAEELLLAAQGDLMDRMKEVKDGQRSIQAYALAPDDEEGVQLDKRL